MKNIIKKFCAKISFFNNYMLFKRRYNEKRAVSFFKYLLFNSFPISFLHYIFKREDYIPIDKYSSDLRGNIFVGACTRIQRPGCYIQGRGKVFIGDYVGIASNVVVISGNHGINDQDSVIRKETLIGDYCWLASNVSILAGVILGPRTIVGAGSVVTKSFPEGYCVIAGNPAKIIRKLDSTEVVKMKDKVEFYGYLSEKRFGRYYNKYYNNLHFDYPIHEISDNVFFKLSK